MEIIKSNLPDKKRSSVILDPERKKKLMKKLEKIKLNRSHGSNSYFDLTAFYESKIRKLKGNNVSLAKALADQRQVTQSWYDEVITLKAELHESREDVLKYRLTEEKNNETAIHLAAERRIKEIAEPLEAAVKESFESVVSLVESMTKVKKILSTLLKSKWNSEKMNFTRSSHGGCGSRPPLSRTPKSPRKNVVHPMVEGHVLQPATIHIPRMTLVERRRYRLQDRGESACNALTMSIIGERSISTEDTTEESLVLEAEEGPEATNSVIRSQGSGLQEASTPELVHSRDGSSSEAQNSSESGETTPTRRETRIRGQLGLASLEQRRSERTEALISLQPVSPSVTLTPPSNVPEEAKVACVHGEENSTSEPKGNAEESSTLQIKENKTMKPVVNKEDPLEGPSWLYTKQQRGSKKRKKSKGSSSTWKRTSGMHVLTDSSSDSDGDAYPSIQRAKQRCKNSIYKICPEFSQTSPRGTSAISPISKQTPKSGSKQKNNTNRLDASEQMSDNDKKNLSDKRLIINQSLDVTQLTLSESRLEELEKRVSRRSKKQSSTYNAAKVKCDSPFNEEVRSTPPINGEGTFEEKIDFSSKQKLERKRSSGADTNGTTDTVSTSSCDSKGSDKLCDGALNNCFVDMTCHLDSSMELTKCIAKDLGISSSSHDLGLPTYVESEPSLLDIHEKNEVKELSLEEKKKPNRFFKSSSKYEPKGTEPVEKTPYDLSMLETTFSLPDSFMKGKENIPPDIQEELSGSEADMKLRDVSVVIEDIMKSSLPEQDLLPSEPQSQTEQTSDLDDCKSVHARFYSKRSKRATVKFVEQSPAKKLVKSKIGRVTKSQSSRATENEQRGRNKNSKKSKLQFSKTNMKKNQKHFSQDDDVADLPAAEFPVESTVAGESTSTSVQNFPLLKNIESNPDLDDICNDLTNLLQMNNIGGSEKNANLVDWEESGAPLPTPPSTKKEYSRGGSDKEDDDDEDEIQFLCVASPQSPPSSPGVVFKIDATEETIKFRPRRAAANISSFKEPLLNVKIRQEVTKKKKQKRNSKKTSKR